MGTLGGHNGDPAPGGTHSTDKRGKFDRWGFIENGQNALSTRPALVPLGMSEQRILRAAEQTSYNRST
jgi:hypothetical protein